MFGCLFHKKAKWSEVKTEKVFYRSEYTGNIKSYWCMYQDRNCPVCNSYQKKILSKKYLEENKGII